MVGKCYFARWGGFFAIMYGFVGTLEKMERDC